MITASFPSLPCKVHVQHSSFHSPSVIIQTDQLNFVCSFRRDHQFSKDTNGVDKYNDRPVLWMPLYDKL
jgi:hypothetical protein